MKSTTYGKPSAELLQHKQSFFDENDKHLHKQQTIAELYRSQQARQKCKNCDHELSTQHDFIKDTIAYSLCKNCNHP